MADLEIPESAVRAAWVEYALITFETEQIDEPHIAAALAKAAPIIVAAELRALADECSVQRCPHAKVTRQRADELDPQGGAQ